MEPPGLSLAGFCLVAQPHGSERQRHLGIGLGVDIGGIGCGCSLRPLGPGYP